MQEHHNEEPHTHVVDGKVIVHTHTHNGKTYTHAHTCDSGTEQEGMPPHHDAHHHPNARAVSNRLARAIGHLEKVKRMVDNDEDCAEVLVQLAAVRSAINNAGKVLLTDHLNHCIIEAAQDGDMEKIEEINKAIKSFIK